MAMGGAEQRGGEYAQTILYEILKSYYKVKKQ